MTSSHGSPFVSDAFMCIDLDDALREVRSMLDVVAPSYLVVTDHESDHEVVVLDTDTVWGLVTQLDDDVDVDLDQWTGAELLQELGAAPSVVVGMESHLTVPTSITDPDLSRPLVVLVDDAVRLLVDAATPAEDAAAHPDIEEMQFVAGGPHGHDVQVAAVTGEGSFMLEGEPTGRPRLEPMGPSTPEPVVTGLQVIVPGVVQRLSTVPLVATLTRPGDDQPDLTFDAAVGDLISVVVWPQAGIEIVGSATGTIEVSAAGTEDSTTVELRITGLHEASAIVEGFRGQSSLGSVLIELQVVLGGGQPPAAPAARVIPLLPGHAPRSDLAIHIVEATEPGTGDRGLRFVAIEADASPVAFPFQKVTGDPHGYLAPLFASINQSLARPAAGQPPPPPAAADLIVRSIGVGLNDQLLPAPLRQFLWERRSSIRSIVVHTDESVIPWELCLLTHAGADGRVEEVGYLCELFELTRWRPRLPAREELTMRSIGVIAPGDSGLTSRDDEVSMLEGLRTSARDVELLIATGDKVLDVLKNGSYDVLHFIGHGELPDPARASSARLVLAGSSYLAAEWIGGALANFGLAKPLVFLNACRLGSASPGLVGPSGFARAVLDAGSAAFVGAHWDVVDTKAHDFSSVLYEHLVMGEPMGAAAKAARLATKESGDPTWLAYTVFASPSARLVATS